MPGVSPKVTFEVLEAVARSDEEPFYVIHVTDESHDMSTLAPSMHNIWQHMWKSRGFTDATVPLLLILPPGMAMTALSGDELRAAGLARIN